MRILTRLTHCSCCVCVCCGRRLCQGEGEPADERRGQDGAGRGGRHPEALPDGGLRPAGRDGPLPPAARGGLQGHDAGLPHGADRLLPARGAAAGAHAAHVRQPVRSGRRSGRRRGEEEGNPRWPSLMLKLTTKRKTLKKRRTQRCESWACENGEIWIFLMDIAEKDYFILCSVFCCVFFKEKYKRKRGNFNER